MISIDYAARQLGALLHLCFRPDEDWRERLARSIDDVFASFWAIAVAFPFALLSFISMRRLLQTMPELDDGGLLDAPLWFAVITDSIAFVLGWVATLATVLFAAKLLKAAAHAGDLIITFNWAQVITVINQAIPVTLMGLFGSSMIAFTLPVVALNVFLYWRVMREVLNTTIGITVALILALIIVSFLLNLVIGAMASALLAALGLGAA